MESWRRSLPVFLAFSAPTIIWLLVFFLIPLGIVWNYSLSENTSLIDTEFGWNFSNYERIFEPAILTLLWRSLWLAGITTIISLVVAYPVALVIATAEMKWKPWLLLIIILPFWTNLLIRTYALLNILGSRGRANDVLYYLWYWADTALGWIGLGWLLGEKFVPVKFLGTELGVVIGLVYVALPFAILPIYSSLERLDKSFLEASMDLGASQLRTFFFILIPLTTAGLATAAILTFIPTIGSFLTPDLLGRGQVDMIANVIERQFKSANDWPFGSAMSLMLLYVTFIILAIRAWVDMSRDKARRA